MNKAKKGFVDLGARDPCLGKHTEQTGWRYASLSRPVWYPKTCTANSRQCFHSPRTFKPIIMLNTPLDHASRINDKTLSTAQLPEHAVHLVCCHQIWTSAHVTLLIRPLSGHVSTINSTSFFGVACINRHVYKPFLSISKRSWVNSNKSCTRIGKSIRN